MIREPVLFACNYTGMATHERILSHRAASCSHAIVPIHIGRCTTRPSATARRWLGPQPTRDVILASAPFGDAPSSERLSNILSAYEPTPHDSIDEDQVVTKFIAETLLPTRHGKFRLRGYKHSIDGGTTFTEPTAIISGNVEGQENVALRVHDACFTSEVLGSLKCDCAEQLELALQLVQQQPPGLVIYLQQEGRGIGLANKIAAYSLQEQGLDTVDANRALGLPDDCREYTSVRNMLRELGVRSVRLITNNPRKINVLTSLGIQVTGRIPCLVAAGAYNQGYLDAKRDRMAHLLHDEEADATTSASASAAATITTTTAITTGASAAAGAAVEARSGGAVRAVAGGRQQRRRLINMDPDPKRDQELLAAGELNGEFCFWDHGGEPTQAVSAAQAKGGMDLPVGLAHGSNGRVVPVAANSNGGSSCSTSNGNGNGSGSGHGSSSSGSSASSNGNATEATVTVTVTTAPAGAAEAVAAAAVVARSAVTADGGVNGYGHGTNGNFNGKGS